MKADSSVRLDVSPAGPELERFVIRCTSEPGAAWSNEYGWVDNDGYDTFSAAERDLVGLPIEGAWCTAAEMKHEQQLVAAEVGVDTLREQSPVETDSPSMG